MDPNFTPKKSQLNFARIAKGLWLVALMCCSLAAYAYSGHARGLRAQEVHLEAVSIHPDSIFGGGIAAGTVTLSGPAPVAGAVISLTSDSAAVTVPGSITVAAGFKQATFSVATTIVGSRSVASITATLGTHSRHTQLVVLGLGVKSLTLSPATVTGGEGSTATVTLNGVAPTGGVVLSLSSSSPTASVPAMATVDVGQSSVNFAVSTTAVTKQVELRIKANLANSSESAQLVVSPSESVSVTVNPATVVGGAKAVGTLTLSSPAPPNGLEVKLVSSSNAVQVEREVKVKHGTTTVDFDLRTQGVAAPTAVTITASIGNASANTTLNVSPATLVSVTLDPNGVGGGASTTGLVTLSGAAPQGGALVNLASSLTIAQVQTSVKIPAGQMSATFAVATTPVTTSTAVTITASYESATQTAALTVNPLGLASLAVHAGNGREGKAATGVVELNSPAGVGGVVVSIASDNAAATVPATVTVPAGHSSASFSIAASAVASPITVTITASLGGTSKSASLTLNPSALHGLILHPDRVLGGSNATGTISLNGYAPVGGLVVTLVSNSPSAVVPATVTVPAGQNAATFAVTTLVVTSRLTVQITATAGGVSKSENLTISTQKG